MVWHDFVMRKKDVRVNSFMMVYDQMSRLVGGHCGSVGLS